MDLTHVKEEDDATGPGMAHGAARGPIENPRLEPIPNDPLALPHPGEPGVKADGTAAPLENPDDTVSADPLVSAG